MVPFLVGSDPVAASPLLEILQVNSSSPIKIKVLVFIIWMIRII
jgi:hypothetical protein